MSQSGGDLERTSKIVRDLKKGVNFLPGQPIICNNERKRGKFGKNGDFPDKQKQFVISIDYMSLGKRV